jgi:hypothetical protein
MELAMIHVLQITIKDPKIVAKNVLLDVLLALLILLVIVLLVKMDIS